jgi:hypothetical protein
VRRESRAVRCFAVAVGRQETGRSVARSLSVHARLATASCEAIETKKLGVSHAEVVRPRRFCKCRRGRRSDWMARLRHLNRCLNTVIANRPKTLTGLTQNGNVAGPLFV